MKLVWMVVTGTLLVTGLPWDESWALGELTETRITGNDPDTDAEMSLQQCVETALRHSPDLAGAQYQAGAARAVDAEAVLEAAVSPAELKARIR